MEIYPHVTMTFDVKWDPSDHDEDWDPHMVDQIDDDEDDDDSPELVADNPCDSDDDDIDDDDDDVEDNDSIAEEFTPHELNVFKCVQAAQSDSSTNSDDSTEDKAQESPSAHFAGTSALPRSISPKKPDHEAS